MMESNPPPEHEGPVRDRKRTAARQLVAGEGDDTAEEAPTGNVKAAPEVLAQRRILKVVIPKAQDAPGTGGAFANVKAMKPPSPAASPANPFAKVTPLFGSTAPAAPNLPKFNFGAPKTVAQPEASALVVTVPPQVAASTTSPLTSKPDGAAIPSVFGSQSKFQFSFSAPPPASNGTAPAPSGPLKAAVPTVTLVPVDKTVDANDVEVFKRGGFKLFLHDAKDGWKERGEVAVRLIVNKRTGPNVCAMLAVAAAKTLTSLLAISVGPNLLITKREGHQFMFVAVYKGSNGAERYLLRGPKDGAAVVGELLAALDVAAAAVTENKLEAQ